MYPICEIIILIDRLSSTSSTQCSKSKETELVKQLTAKMRLTGPITVADYMREVLTNPTAVNK